MYFLARRFATVCAIFSEKHLYLLFSKISGCLSAKIREFRCKLGRLGALASDTFENSKYQNACAPKHRELRTSPQFTKLIWHPDDSGTTCITNVAKLSSLSKTLSHKSLGLNIVG